MSVLEKSCTSLERNSKIKGGGGKKKETTYPAVKETCIRPTEQGVSESKKKEEQLYIVYTLGPIPPACGIGNGRQDQEAYDHLAILRYYHYKWPLEKLLTRRLGRLHYTLTEDDGGGEKEEEKKMVWSSKYTKIHSQQPRLYYLYLVNISKGKRDWIESQQLHQLSSIGQQTKQKRIRKKKKISGLSLWKMMPLDGGYDMKL